MKSPPESGAEIVLMQKEDLKEGLWSPCAWNSCVGFSWYLKNQSTGIVVHRLVYYKGSLVVQKSGANFLFQESKEVSKVIIPEIR